MMHGQKKTSKYSSFLYIKM